MFTEAYSESSRTSTMELFSLRLNHILKMYSIRLNCFLGSIFTQLVKKLTTENFGRKSLLLTIENIFFRNSKLCNGFASPVKKDF